MAQKSSPVVASPSQVERLVKALELQIAYQEANPGESKAGKAYDPHKVPFFAKFLGGRDGGQATNRAFSTEVQFRLDISRDAYQQLVRSATDAAVVVDAWAKYPGRCLTLPKYVTNPNGKVTRIVDDSPSLF